MIFAHGSCFRSVRFSTACFRPVITLLVPSSHVVLGVAGVERGVAADLPGEVGAVAAAQGVVGGVLDGVHDGEVLVSEGDNPAKEERENP